MNTETQGTTMTDGNKDNEANGGEPVVPSPSAGLARPIGCPREVWDAVIQVRAAHSRLADDYPQWNESGRKYAVEVASQELRHAHQNLMHYIGEITKSLD